MARTTPVTSIGRIGRIGAVALVGLLVATGCSGPADLVDRVADGEPSSGSRSMSVEKPAEPFKGWTESLDRVVREEAEKRMGRFKELLDGEPTSAVGTAYTPVEEVFWRGRPVERPGDDRLLLISAVAGTVSDPEATLNVVFASLTTIADVRPVDPGPLGGIARCGTGQSDGSRVDVCVWVDRHTVGEIEFVRFRSADGPDEMFRRLRAQTEHQAR